MSISKTARLLEAATATNSAPTVVTDGEDWKGLDEALLVLKDRAGSGTMTCTAKLWGLIKTKNNAKGVITCDTKANSVDAETIIIPSGSKSVTYELDVTGDGVTAGNVEVDVSGATTAADISALLTTAINGQRSETSRMRAADGSGTVNIFRTDYSGTSGNVTITGTAEGTNAWAFSDPADGYDFVWVPLGTSSTAADKGKINDGNSMGETGTDEVAHVEVISGLKNFRRLYLEVTAIGGTATGVDAYLIPR